MIVFKNVSIIQEAMPFEMFLFSALSAIFLSGVESYK